MAPVDVVLLDILMPGPDGLETLRRLHEVRPGLPVVVLSGLDKASTAATAMRLGAVDYVTKPFQDEMLAGVLRAAVQGERRLPAAPLMRARPLLALIGCEVGLAAGLAATLHAQVDVMSYPDPLAARLAADARTTMCIVDTTGRQTAWLERVALMLERLPDMRTVVLVDPSRVAEAHFVLGERCLALELPVRLADLLDLVGTLLPQAPIRGAWRDARTAAVIDKVWREYARFRAGRLVSQLGISRGYLSRCFRRRTGMSIGTYVTLVRIYAARHLFEHTDSKLDTVATVVGFHDASHMSRAFVKLTGRRPGEYRSRSDGGDLC